MCLAVYVGPYMKDYFIYLMLKLSSTMCEKQPEVIMLFMISWLGCGFHGV